MYELRFDGRVKKFKSLRELVVFEKRLLIKADASYGGMPLDAVDEEVRKLYKEKL